jgi:hypothetical protein
MQRLREIEVEYRSQKRRLEAAYGSLVEAFGDDPDRFARHWRTRAEAWPFDRLNRLVREHNEWYPIEARLPMDPRTRDYRPVRGASYLRLELGPEWVLDHLPLAPASWEHRLPLRAPREPLSVAQRSRRP